MYSSTQHPTRNMQDVNDPHHSVIQLETIEEHIGTLKVCDQANRQQVF